VFPEFEGSKDAQVGGKVGFQQERAEAWLKHGWLLLLRKSRPNAGSRMGDTSDGPIAWIPRWRQALEWAVRTRVLRGSCCLNGLWLVEEQSRSAVLIRSRFSC